MDVFDYVIVGAGSAGSVLAARLSEAPGGTVCVLEAGPADRNPVLKIPAGIFKVRTDPRFIWKMATEPVPALGGRVVPFIQGRVVGGGGSVNGMVYARGQSADFDEWAQKGNTGWSYTDLLPYFRRSENRVGGDPRLRGRDGPISVSDLRWRDSLTDAFVDAAANLGLPRNEDYNGAAQDGVFHYQYSIDARGRRSSSARTYLHPAIRRGNVDLRSEAVVESVVIDGRRATGVRYRRNGDSALTEVHARKEVILCAGAIHTPKLMQLSGIGPAAVLREHGVEVVLALPGVGENLQDHFTCRMVLDVKGATTINEIVNGPRLINQVGRWLVGAPSIMSVGAMLGCSHWKSRPGLKTDDYLVTFTPGSFKEGIYGWLDHRPRVTLTTYQMRPESSGSVHIRSTNPIDPPAVMPNYLSAQTDRDVLVTSLKKIREIAATKPLSLYCTDEVMPGTSVRSDDELLDFVSKTGLSCMHFTGTCRMGPDHDVGAVVDLQLRVRGIDGLRIADASVMPTITSGNTNAPTMMIAEKAADLILGRRAAA